MAVEQESSLGRRAGVFRKDGSRSTSLVAKLKETGIEAVAIESTDALRKLLDEQKINVLILDNRIDSFFNGLDVIRKLRAGFPEVSTILVDPTREIREEEKKSVGGMTLLNSAESDDDIVKAVVGQRNGRSAIPELISDRAQEIVSRQTDLPVLSQLTLKMLRYLGQPTEAVPIAELCREISIDPKATVVLLKAANASVNGVSREIANVLDAVRVLGVRPTIGHVLNAAVATGVGVMTKGLPSDVQIWHARRGMIIASTVATFASQLEERCDETAFLVGILQDVGILCLLRAYPREYLTALKRWRGVGHLKLAGVEQMELGCTHAEVSAALMRRWDMPHSLIGPVLRHLQGATCASGSRFDAGLHRAMTVAESLVDFVDAPHAMRRHTLNNALGEYGPEKRAACVQSLTSAAAKASQAFQLLVVPLPSANELETLLRSTLGENATTVV